MDPALVTFFYGCGGSVAIEVVTMINFLQRGKSLPMHYSDWRYYVLRLFVVLAAGGLAHAYGIKDNPLLAINIGASAPLILQALSKGVR